MLQDQIVGIFGWMAAINILFFVVGFLKITVLRGPVGRMLTVLFGPRAQDLQTTLPLVLFFYWICILVFNIVPYLAFRIILP